MPPPPTEFQIREHLAALKWALAKPCDCLARGGTVHAMQCRVGGALIQAEINGLEWVLGEASPRYLAMLEEMNNAAKNG